MKLDETFAPLGDKKELTTKLRSICDVNSLLGAALVLVDPDEYRIFTSGADHEQDPMSQDTRINFSCAAKLLVTSFAADLIRQDYVDLDDAIARHLDFEPTAKRQLEGTTIRHLLSHTDGIGYRGMGTVPTTQSGFIDIHALLSVICSEDSIFAPGEYCTEGHCGFGLLGALIERYRQEPFSDLVREELKRLSSSAVKGREEVFVVAPMPESSICPASGKGLALNAIELGEFLRRHLWSSRSELPCKRLTSPVSLFEPQAQYPGWAPSTTGCALGWKTFTGGWVGHTGISMGETVFLRLHPQKRVALAFLCRGHAPAAYASLGRLVGGLLPELAMRDAPRVLRQCIDTDGKKYTGTFGSNTRRIRVSGTNLGALEIAVSEGRRFTSTSGKGSLIAAADDSFFVQQPNTTNIFFIQYLKSKDSSDLDLLWDARALWRRCSS